MLKDLNGFPEITSENYSEYLELTIISTLESRPNFSANITKLPTYIFKSLGVDIRGKRREKISKDIFTKLNHIIQAKIVKKYTTLKNTRIMLSNNYLELTVKRIKKANNKATNIASKDSQLAIDRPSEEMRDDNLFDGNLKRFLLPDLPGLIDDCEDDENNVKNGKGSDAILNLFGDIDGAIPDKESDTKFAAAEGNKEKQLLHQNIIEYLKILLSSYVGLNVKVKFNKIELKIMEFEQEHSIKIYHDDSSKLLKANASIPILDKYLREILYLAESSDFNSIIGLKQINTNDVLVVRKSIPIGDYQDIEMALVSYFGDLYSILKALQ